MKIRKKYICIANKHQKWLNLFSCTIVLNGVSIKFTIKAAKSVRQCRARDQVLMALTQIMIPRNFFSTRCQ